jgi:hypothetical protein
MATERALDTEEGRDPLAEAAKFEPGSAEPRNVYDNLIERVGPPQYRDNFFGPYHYIIMLYHNIGVT